MLRHGYLLLHMLLSDLEYPFLSVFWPRSNFLPRVTSLLRPSGLLLSVMVLSPSIPATHSLGLNYYILFLSSESILQLEYKLL